MYIYMAEQQTGSSLQMDLFSAMRARMVEPPEVEGRGPEVPVVRDPAEVPAVSERDAISDAIVNNNGFIREYRNRYNIIEREYRRFLADADYVIVDKRVRFVPRGTHSTRELVLRVYQHELARLLNRIVTLRNSDKLLPRFIENTTNRGELDSLMADIQRLHEEIEAEIDRDVSSRCSIS